jgi:hypothetical protein
MLKYYSELSSTERSNYSILLSTHEWLNLRERFMKEVKYQCKTCGIKRNWDIDTGEGYYEIDIFEKKDEHGFPGLDSRYLRVKNPVVFHLHHTYYVRRTLPWEYADSCFEVLCEGCHKRVHKEKTILMYANHQLGANQHLTPCFKCGGTGYLAEFNYYLDGVCFGCDGAGFEELKSAFSDSSGSLDHRRGNEQIPFEDLPF